MKGRQKTTIQLLMKTQLNSNNDEKIIICPFKFYFTYLHSNFAIKSK